jgi:phosphotransferase system  glucose/maltose/N-acetylglucosamine-specific IIC component
VFQSHQSMIYVQPRHGFLHGPLTVVLFVWAIALPGLLLLLTAFGPIGWLVGAGAAFLLGVPWLVGIFILWFLRRLT